MGTKTKWGRKLGEGAGKTHSDSVKPVRPMEKEGIARKDEDGANNAFIGSVRARLGIHEPVCWVLQLPTCSPQRQYGRAECRREGLKIGPSA